LLGLLLDPKTQEVIASEMTINFHQTMQSSIPEESKNLRKWKLVANTILIES
jgi:hypothetical protein